MTTYTITNDEVPIVFQENGMVNRILQNGCNLLRCRLGEVPYDRSRGFDGRLFDQPFPQFLLQLRKEVDRVMIWEPRIRVMDATAEMLEDGRIRVTVSVTISRMEEGQ